MLVITAGSIMHVVIAIVILFGVFAFHGRFEESGRLTLDEVVAGQPAALAGLREGDIVTSIDGQAVTAAEPFVDRIRATRPGSNVTLQVLRDGQPLTLQAQLGQNPTEVDPIGYLGVRSESVAAQRKAPAEALGLAFTDLGPQAWNSVKGVVIALNPVNLVQHLTGKTDDIETRPANIVTVARESDRFGDAEGLAGVMLLLAGVNVFVGVFNLFPLLPFDGGHAAIATYERVRSRRGRRYHADVAKMMPVAMTVMALLAFLLFTSIYLDVTKPL
jgi:membrane-associated protease RseP (regulator of RpoE activity)